MNKCALEPVITEQGNPAFVTIFYPKQLDLTASACNDIRQHSYFTVPDTRELPSIPENRNLTEYFVAVDVNNMLHLYASMLYERRILIICSKLSTLTACIHGSAAMLYPMYWQHVYIPVLPPHLLDYCCAPMPYLIGVHFSLMEFLVEKKTPVGQTIMSSEIYVAVVEEMIVIGLHKVRNMALEDVVILNVDTNTLETPFDDLQSLPNDVISSLKNRLKKVSTTTGDGVARAFLKAQAAFFGSYRNALKIEPEEPITFSEEAFVSHYRSGAMRQFLQNATQLQLFKQFIDGRLDLLNSGEGFSDVFEEEINMGEYAGSDKLYRQWLSTVRKGSGAILNTVKTKANPAMKTVYKFDISENGCVSSAEESLPKTLPSTLEEAKDPRLREDRRPITVHFGQVRPPRPHVVKRPKSNITVEGRRTSVSSPEHLVKPFRHYAVFLSEDSSDEECRQEEAPSTSFTESFFFSAPFEWPQPYRTLKESDSAEGDETESPEQLVREPRGPIPSPPDRAASIDLLEDVFSSLDMEAAMQPLGQAKSLEDLRAPKDLWEQPGSFDYQRLDLCRSERGLSVATALKLTHPYTKLWSLGQDDMAIPSKPSTTTPEKPSALPHRPQKQDGILNPSTKEEAPTQTPGSITIPRPQGRKTPELGIVPPPPTARPAKLQAVGGPLGDSSSEQLQMDQQRQAALSPALLPGLLPSAVPQGPMELLQPLSPAPGAAGTGSDALLALLDPLNTAWSGSTIPPHPATPSVAAPFTPQLNFPPTVTPTPFAQPPLNPFVPSLPVAPPTVSLGSTIPARHLGTPPASLGSAYTPSVLLSGSGFYGPHRSQPNLSALSMPNLFGQIPMGAHTSPLQPLGPPAVAPSRIRTLPLARSSARAAEAKQGLALRPGEPPLLSARPPQGLEPALQPSSPAQARDPFEDLLRKTKQDVSPSPAPASTSVEQLRRQWETFE
ncbi:DENN domain-containing protein 1A [Microtus ochrogaster]|uniref:DENN domain-containing protein 1A n=1 Tax=Microtus ochrogaster TaxID=79684 RepID=A0A8J6GXQ9_MICOH|nr:DENN domain-containing protein 1A [Microtus ochrogaster]